MLNQWTDMYLNKIVAEMLDDGIPLEKAVAEFKRKYIATAISKSRSLFGAAVRLGVHRNTLRNDRRRLGL